MIILPIITKEAGNSKFIHWTQHFMPQLLLLKKNTRLKEHIGKTFTDLQDRIIMIMQEQ